MADDRRSWWEDENGKLSMGRVLLVVEFLVFDAVIFLDLFLTIVTARFVESTGEYVSIRVPGEVYISLAGILPILVVWAAGPRIAKHLSPTASAAAGAITGGIARLAERVGGPSPDYHRPPDFVPDNEREEPEPEG